MYFSLLIFFNLQDLFWNVCQEQMIMILPKKEIENIYFLLMNKSVYNGYLKSIFIDMNEINFYF